MNRGATYNEQDLFAFPRQCHREQSEQSAPAKAVSAHERVVKLPDKPTCSPSEAHRCTGISVRQIRYWVEDGTLLAVDSSRNPITSERPGGKPRRWRLVVRRVDGSPIPEKNEFLTLAELLPRITNKEIS